jgi:hypothetical protein
MSRIALLALVLVMGWAGSSLAGGLMSADEGVNSFMDTPTVNYPADHGYQRVNWFVGYDPVYGSCSANIWDGYCPKKCHHGQGRANRCGCGR